MSINESENKQVALLLMHHFEYCAQSQVDTVASLASSPVIE